MKSAATAIDLCSYFVLMAGMPGLDGVSPRGIHLMREVDSHASRWRGQRSTTTPSLRPATRNTSGIGSPALA